MHGGAKRREIAVAGAAVAGVTIAIIWLTDAQVLFWRPPWVDEVHTLLLARSRTPAELLGHLAGGADYGPPLFFMLMAALRGVLGGDSLAPEAMRAFSLVCVGTTLVLAFAVLRRRFNIVPSGLGAAAIGAHPLVVAHAYEGRFYGLWLLCATLFAWSLRGDSTRDRMTSATAAVLLVTSHWYGIITLGLMAAGAAAANGRAWRVTARQLAPAAAGLMVLLLCLPLALGQRAALSVSTWVPDFHWGQLQALAQGFWLSPLLVAAIAVGLFALVVRLRHNDARVFAVAGAFREPSIAALSALAAMPLALVTLSLLGQPSMLGRYALPTVLGWPPLVAAALALAGRWPARLFVMPVAWYWIASYVGEVAAKGDFERTVLRQLAAARRALTANIPVAAQSMHTLYAIGYVDTLVARQVRYLELSDAALDALVPPDSRFYQLNKGARVERDVVRVHARRFGFPRMVPHDLLASADRFALIVSDDTAPRGLGRAVLARILFPRHDMRAAGPEALLAERR